jgi:hypothetical protein
MGAEQLEVPSVGSELSAADFGDPRLTRRLSTIAERAMAAPDAGFPQMAADDAELEGVYRFLSNESVTAEAILAPHVTATVTRAASQGTVLAIHDTTSFEFGGSSPRDGLGLMIGNGQGFFAHVALAVVPGEARLALGVLGLEHWRRATRKGSNHNKKTRLDPNRESLRWGRMLAHVEGQRRAHGFECIHVTDREGDIIEVLLDARRLGARFVIRSAHDRALGDGDGHVRARVAALAPKLQLEIELSARHDKGRPGVLRTRHPKRAARVATIGIAGCAVELSAGQHHRDEPPIHVNVVHVHELAAPQGEAPIDWLLYTTEPIDTDTQLKEVVDAYRARWVIEEYFKALKTGCAFEKRQLESYAALTNALAMFIPVAWRLLLARSVTRLAPNAPARAVLSDVQLRLLVHKLKLAEPPQTAKDATYAIARLGGHLRRNGDPGWQTLGRGFEALLLMQAGWHAALAAGGRDQ